ncbi:class II glutamine amidotransferase [Pseudomonas peli]|uniref:class II glutamine amidotransferase n=1 Tax=Pseudomonas peli TaxID=592361 RepID=UPI0024ACC4B0|nr:class II glutamine amidotransferase [Pseudomonas peli]
MTGCSASARPSWCRSPGACAVWPARLKDVDLIVDFQTETTPNDVVTVIATEALTENETWTRYEPGQWALWRHGECVSHGQS